MKTVEKYSKYRIDKFWFHNPTISISDVFDGYIARKKREATSLGAILDPTADKLLITCACLLIV